MKKPPVARTSSRSTPKKAAIDPIRAEVVARFLLATAEEMGATLMRTAFSPNIKERADCSTAIFNVAGEDRKSTRLNSSH